MIIDSSGRRHSTVTFAGIYGFFGDYSFLSNFATSPFELNGDVWPTVEHYYMWMKSESPIDKAIILSNNSPQSARNYGRNEIILRSDWDAVKTVAMLTGVTEKFRQNVHLREKLIDTFPKYLEETNNWNDLYGGADVNGNGQNMLGKTLMQVRDLCLRKLI